MGSSFPRARDILSLKSFGELSFDSFAPPMPPVRNSSYIFDDHATVLSTRRFFEDLCAISPTTRSLYTVENIRHLRDSPDVTGYEPEFLVACLETPGEPPYRGPIFRGPPIFIITERRDSSDILPTGVVANTKPSSTSSLNPREMMDYVQLLDRRKLDALIAKRKARNVVTYTLKSGQLSVLEYARILFVASKISPCTSTKENFRFYCSVTFNAVRQLSASKFDLGSQQELPYRLGVTPPTLSIQKSHHQISDDERVVCDGVRIAIWEMDVIWKYRKYYANEPEPIGAAMKEGIEIGVKEGQERGIAIGEARTMTKLRKLLDEIRKMPVPAAVDELISRALQENF